MGIVGTIGTIKVTGHFLCFEMAPVKFYTTEKWLLQVKLNRVVELKKKGRISSNRFECEKIRILEIENVCFQSKLDVIFSFHPWVSGKWDKGKLGAFPMFHCRILSFLKILFIYF